MYRKILVPVDGSDTAARGVHEAIGLARALQAGLHLLHVVDDYPLIVELAALVDFEQARMALRARGEKILSDARKQAADQAVPAGTELVEIATGRVADAILATTREAGCDLVVMGTHGRRGLSRTMTGSDAESVVRASSVPVMLVRRPEGIP